MMKRKLASQENDGHTPKRKIRSCETCRRLKTRCETQNNTTACHRCELLKLDCSLAAEAFETPATPPDELDKPMPQPEAVFQATPQPWQDYSQRLIAVENSLAHVRSSLDELLRLSTRASSSQTAFHRSRMRTEVPNSPITAPLNSQSNGPLVADRNSRIAPMSLIRDMTHYILGDEREQHRSDVSDDIVTKGIITEELAHALFAGFTQLSRRWHFMKAHNPTDLRQTSSLLFASCVLSGLQIDSSLHGSQLHHDLYQHVSGLLSRSMLVSPLSLEAIQSMLIFSMWNLVPNKDVEYLDTWLLSGVAGMQGMLAINFEQLLKPRMCGMVDPKSRETLRSWNLICLCHLQFSAGTGRPPVISRQYLKQCKNILELPSYTSRDRLVASGVDLYDALCNVVNSESVQTDSLVWDEIDDWRKRCGEFFELDSTKPLRFAYSCSYLILTRRTLKYLSEQPSKEQTQNAATDLDPSLFIQLAVEHAHRILHLFLAMSDLTAFVRPAYENLLCSFAMVTLSEFATYLDDIDATLALMERTSQHVQLGGKAEPVSKWALSVMRKYVFDMKRASGHDLTQRETFIPRPNLGDLTGTSIALPDDVQAGEWSTGDVTYQDFPSLEEMFLGN